MGLVVYTLAEIVVHSSQVVAPASMGVVCGHSWVLLLVVAFAVVVVAGVLLLVVAVAVVVVVHHIHRPVVPGAEEVGAVAALEDPVLHRTVVLSLLPHSFS